MATILHQYAKSFRSIAQLARAFDLAALGLEGEIQKQLRFVGVRIRDTAARKFGHYQPQIGEYPGWVALAPATVEAKARAGGAEDPLIGHYAKQPSNAWPVRLRNSIESHVEGLTVKIGSANPLAEIHEYGAPGRNIPPRPFLRPAVWENREYARDRMQVAWANTIRLIARYV
jgi:hypothetical protein